MKNKASITIQANPAGYHSGSFGYTVTIGDRLWFDGGFNSKSEARRAAKLYARIAEETVTKEKGEG